MKNIILKLFICPSLIILLTIMPAQADDIFSFSVLKLPYSFKSEVSWNTTITTKKDWQAFYDRIVADSVIPPTPVKAPLIDFDQYQIVAGGLGIRPNGGFSLAVASVNELSTEILVRILDIRAGKNCAVIAAFTDPSITILIKKTIKPIKFSVATLTQDCS